MVFFYLLRKVGLVMVFCFVFASGLFLIGGHMALQPANAGAGIPVVDTNMWMQNITKAISKTTKAVEDTVETGNSVNSLTSLSPEGLLANQLGLTTTFNDLLACYQSYQGFMNTNETASQAFSSSFGQVGNFFDGKSRVPLGQGNTLSQLEKMNQDTIYLGQVANKNTETNFANLRTSVTNFSNGIGSKQKTQAMGHVEAQEAQASRSEIDLTTMRNNSLLGQSQYRATEEAIGLGRSQRYIDSFTTYNTEYNNVSSDGWGIDLAKQF